MADNETLIERLDADAKTQVRLAMIAESEPVAAMHLDLALFSKEQARVLENIDEDGGWPGPLAFVR